MKIRELIDILNQYPDDFEIVTSSDAEGNNYSPVASYGIGVYIPQSTYSGEFTSLKEAKEYLEIEDAVENAVCLWPTN